MKKRTVSMDIGKKITDRNSPDFSLGTPYDFFDEKIQVLRGGILSKVRKLALLLIIIGSVFLIGPAGILYEFFRNTQDNEILIPAAVIFAIPTAILFILAIKYIRVSGSIKNGEFSAYEFEITGTDSYTDEDGNPSYLIKFAENTGAVFAEFEDYKNCRVGDIIRVYFIKDPRGKMFYCAYKLK